MAEMFKHAGLMSFKPIRPSEDIGSVETATRTDVSAMVGGEPDLDNLFSGLVKGEPTALLIDANNLFRRASDCGFRIDYTKLHRIIAERCDLRCAIAYSALDRDDRNAHNWVTYMKHNGYKVVTKNIHRYENADGDSVTKGDMDVEIAVGAWGLSKNISHVLVGTCDQDFIPVIHKLQEGGYRKASIIGIRDHELGGMSESLIRSATNFYDLGKIIDTIALKRFPRREVRRESS